MYCLMSLGLMAIALAWTVVGRHHHQLRKLQALLTMAQDNQMAQLNIICALRKRLDRQGLNLHLSDQRITELEIENANVHAYNRELGARIERQDRQILNLLKRNRKSVYESFIFRRGSFDWPAPFSWN